MTIEKIGFESVSLQSIEELQINDDIEYSSKYDEASGSLEIWVEMSEKNITSLFAMNFLSKSNLKKIEKEKISTIIFFH